jgi:hypothetical protein
MQRAKGKGIDMQGGERYVESKGKGGWLMAECYFRVRKLSIYTCFFFLSVSWLNRFGSVQSVSDFRNRTRIFL